MNMAETCRDLNIAATEEQLAAGRYLESRGLKFCCDFGTDNVIKIADKMFQEECERIMRRDNATT